MSLNKNVLINQATPDNNISGLQSTNPRLFQALKNMGDVLKTVISTSPLSTANQDVHTVYAGPSSGSSGLVSFRLLVDSDIPDINISQVINLITVLANKVNISTSINTTAPLTGGGTLASSLTLGVSDATLSSVGVVKPDGTTITISGGTISAVTTLKKITATFTLGNIVTISNTLGVTTIIVQVYDISGNLVTPQNINVTSAVITVTFGIVFSGTVVAIG